MKKEKEMQQKENEYKKVIGKKIKVARMNQKYTQEKLAEKLDISTRYVSQLERGIAFGSATTIINLCKALNINANFLFQDLIHADSSHFNNTMDPKFTSDYLLLTQEHKEVLHCIASELLKIQQKNS